MAACRGYVIALAVEGEKLSSEGFAALVKKLTDEGKEITFLIGSSCGLAAEVKRAADFKLSFSDMTLPASADACGAVRTGVQGVYDKCRFRIP